MIGQTNRQTDKNYNFMQIISVYLPRGGPFFFSCSLQDKNIYLYFRGNHKIMTNNLNTE